DDDDGEDVCVDVAPVSKIAKNAPEHMNHDRPPSPYRFAGAFHSRSAPGRAPPRISFLVSRYSRAFLIVGRGERAAATVYPEWPREPVREVCRCRRRRDRDGRACAGGCG